ncbi:MAG: YraN family protein [Caldilineaceae bacterium]|nr:YraN family protein [Caldilineaceae bacterium]
MNDGRRSLGTQGELIAVRALEKAGLRIVERNWRCRAGELDIIAEECAPDFSRGASDSRWLVVVEVRTRRGQAFGSALQSFTPNKQEKLRELATIYVQESKWPGPWRIDAVAVQMDRSGKLISVEHIRHAVTG